MTNIADQFIPQIENLDRANAELRKQRKDLEATIAQQTAVIEERMASNIDEMNRAVLAMLRSDGLDLLTDPDNAVDLYRFGFNGGFGPVNFFEEVHKAIGLPVVSAYGEWIVEDPSNPRKSLPTPVLTLFAAYTEDTPVEVINDVSSNVQQVFEVQEEILAPYGIQPSIMCGWQNGREIRIYRDENSEGFVVKIPEFTWAQGTYESLADALVAASRTDDLETLV